MAKNEVQISEATLEQLRAFAVSIGLEFSDADKITTMRAKVAHAVAPKVVIQVEPAGAAPASPARKRAGAATEHHDATGEPIQHEFVTIQLARTQLMEGKPHEFFGHNGVSMLIPFDKPARIPVKFLNSVRGAVETHYTEKRLEDGSIERVPHEQPAYPFSILGWG